MASGRNWRAGTGAGARGAADHLMPLLRRWAVLLDSKFRIPGTRIRFGLDPLLSLVPGLGELASPAFTVALLVQGIGQHVPKIVLVRMILNALVDALLGAIPLAGTVGDIFFRANTRNLALLERHASPGRPPTRSDYVFVFGIAIAFGLLAIVPVIVGLYLAGFVLEWLGLM
jgi:hypothetical protein